MCFSPVTMALWYQLYIHTHSAVIFSFHPQTPANSLREPFACARSTEFTVLILLHILCFTNADNVFHSRKTQNHQIIVFRGLELLGF